MLAVVGLFVREDVFVREALQAWGRTELIGTGPEHLVPPGAAYGAWKRKRKRQDGQDVASRQEQREENWEMVAQICS